MNADITVCILSYNRADFLREALEAVLQQSVTPAEIIIFDNGSRSEVYESIRPLMGQRVKWVGSDGTQNANWNFRRAIESAKSKYVVVLHDDDRICSDFLKDQLAYLDQNPHVGVSTCNGFFIDKNGRRTGLMVRNDLLPPQVLELRSDTDVALIYANDSCLPFASAVYRNEVLKKVRLREEYGKVIDAVLFCDLAQQGQVAFLAKPLYEIRTHEGQDSGFFSDETKNQLDNFFWNCVGDTARNFELRATLQRRYTREVILLVLAAFKSSSIFKSLGRILPRLMDKRFSFRDLFRRVFRKALSRFDLV